METGLTLLGVIVFLLFAFLVTGGPAILADRLRSRRQEMIRRQIALTEAIDAELGAIVSPVVKKPLWGPCQIRISVPFSRPMVVERVLALTHETLAVLDRVKPPCYQIVLTPK